MGGGSFKGGVRSTGKGLNVYETQLCSKCKGKNYDSEDHFGKKH